MSTGLAGRTAVFLPGDPPRTAEFAFHGTDGDDDVAQLGENRALTIIVPHGAGVRRRSVDALVVPIERAVPLLARSRNRGDAHPTTAFWRSVVLFALQLVARGRLLPGVSPDGYDAWRAGPLDHTDVERLRELASAMPPEARAVPVSGVSPLSLPEPEPLVRAFVDAVADALPRSPAAVRVAGGAAFAAREPQHIPSRRAWAAEIATGLDLGVRVSLRVEFPDDPDDDSFRGVVQLRSLSDPLVIADASQIWLDRVHDERLGPRPQVDALLTLRRAARVWEPLERLLRVAAPTSLELSDDEVLDLLGDAAGRLGAAGVDVHVPKDLARGLTAAAEIRSKQVESALPAYFSPETLLSFQWRLSLGDELLSDEEMDRIAEATRPLVRLRDQWVLVDASLIRKARERDLGTITGIDALGAALSGTVEADGESAPVTTTGWLEELHSRLADPGRASDSIEQPDDLNATLRQYQLRGLGWLNHMLSLGLGCCLADDMGLGKTITLIALHLHRAGLMALARPTLVVCPTSLLTNWEREIQRFAPGVPVLRYHGAGRSLEDAAAGFVLTTYGTLRVDAERLAAHGWDLVVADEAQHAKNPHSRTARALRMVPSDGRVALTGTPIENNLTELWALLDWTTPGLLGPLKRFRSRFANAIESGDDPPAAERLSRLVGPFLLRRRKSDPGIAPELPPKTETDHLVKLTNEQAALYEAVVRETMAEITQNTGIARRGLVLKLLTALKQVCDHPAHYLRESEPATDGRSGKLDLLDELLDTTVAENHATLVFTQYVEMGRILHAHLTKRGIACEFLHGQTSVKRRTELVDRFQSGEMPVFLLSLKAAGVGLNLTNAEHVVHYDRWWNPAVEDQATDRAYRIGQTKPVQVHRLISEGTVEERVAEALGAKRDLADAVLASGEAALSELSDEELSELVSLRKSH